MEDLILLKRTISVTDPFGSWVKYYIPCQMGWALSEIIDQDSQACWCTFTIEKWIKKSELDNENSKLSMFYSAMKNKDKIKY